MEALFEIRKLHQTIVNDLSMILDPNDSWKTLMKIIPKYLNEDTFQSDITATNKVKYKTGDFYTIEEASRVYKRSCTEILLDEWGTSGKVLPTLGHLKYLLNKAELYRGADYIGQLLGDPPTIRYQIEDPVKDQVDSDIEKILDKMDYPSSAIADINQMNSPDTNINYSNSSINPIIPKIVISEDSFQNSIPKIVKKDKTESNLIQFSSSTILPELSELMNDSSPQESDANLPEMSILMSNSNQESAANIPEFSALGITDSTDNSEINIPQISMLISSSSAQEEEQLPAFSQLLSSSNVSIQNQLHSQPSTRHCTSPLPFLSLNTTLPRFTYCELEQATNNFDITPFSKGGRFLGSGGFGEVFYAPNLLSKPAAIKKLRLENEMRVNIDDAVTKQFRNEVEILSRYKQENLLNLLGYSCDGHTYCLIYDYVEGGALKDRLQRRDGKLIWTERLYIARGTARAIAYLHTAFETPLIHRDVKSANILLDENNKPKLCDFGLIKLIPNQDITTNTCAIGTSAYMAPEAFSGEVSVKLDTFSFGVVLLELLTSLAPSDDNREDKDLISHVAEVCDNDIKKLLDLSAGSWVSNGNNFGEKLYDIANECLEEQNEKRPSMVDVAKKLDQLITSQ